MDRDHKTSATSLPARLSDHRWLRRILLGQANIAVYPVMVRSIMKGSGIARSHGLPPLPGAGLLDIQDGFRKFARTLGGSGFTDATEIQMAVSAAEEDANNYYVLGFYPSGNDLDGSTHQLTLEVSKKVAKAARRGPDLPPGVLGLKAGIRESGREAFRRRSFHSVPWNATAISITAAIVADPAKPGAREIRSQRCPRRHSAPARGRPLRGVVPDGLPI